jgi:hypothetical protein
MKVRVAICVLVALCCAGHARAQQSAATEAEQAARDFLFALYANDAADVQRRVLPGEDIAPLIGPQTFTQTQLDALRKNIAAVPLHVGAPPSLDGKPLAGSAAPFPVGTKIAYLTQYRGVGMVIPLQHTESGWKVDVRFWLAMRKQRDERPQKTDPEIVAKGFLCYLLAKEPGALGQFASQPIKGEEYTSANNLPSGDLDQVLSLCVEMPVVRARQGERVVLPSGEVAVGADQGESLVLIGLMGPVEVPFLLKRIGDTWKVVPQKYFEMLREAGAL